MDKDKLDLPPEAERTVTRAPYVAPKIVVLGNVRDLTLSGGTSAPDSKTSRGKATTM